MADDDCAGSVVYTREGRWSMKRETGDVYTRGSAGDDRGDHRVYTRVVNEKRGTSDGACVARRQGRRVHARECGR